MNLKSGNSAFSSEHVLKGPEAGVVLLGILSMAGQRTENPSSLTHDLA